MEWEVQKLNGPFYVLQVFEHNLQDEIWAVLVTIDKERMVCEYGLTDGMERPCHMGRKLQ